MVTEKHEFDDIQDLIISPPSVTSSKHVGRQLPTLLEREAKALGGSTVFSRKERIEAVNGLLDLLEIKGVSSGYAFEFVRHAGDLIDDLIVEAKQKFVENVVDLSSPFEEALANAKAPEGLGSLPNEVSIADLKREKKISKLLEISQEEESKLSGDATLSESISELAFRVSVCAERRGLARLVHYFQLIGMKALNIPKVLPHVEPGIDKVMAKVEFLRSLGVKYLHLPVILVTWPQLLSYQCDTLALNVDYLVSLGLAHKDIGKMVIKFPQILGRDVQTELHKSVEILENLGVQLRDVKKLVVRYPVLLTEDAPKKLDPLVNYLTELGVRKEHIGTVLIRRPLLLDSDVEKDLLPVGNYLKSLNASPDDIDKILMSFPQLFCYDVDQASECSSDLHGFYVLHQVLLCALLICGIHCMYCRKDFRPTVLHLESLGVEPSLMGKLFRRHPQLLKNRRSLELKLDFLLSLGLEPKDLGKVIYNAPQLLCLSVGENMFPTVKFLESISIEGPSLLKVLKLKPMILAYNVETKLKPNVKFLRSIQIKQGEIGKLVARHPQLLTLSIDRNLKPTVNYLLKLGFTRGDVADMVRNLPSILGFSVVTVLAPKYGYLVDVMKRSRKEVVQFPQFFSYSLANRIIPRHQRLGKLFDLVSLSSVYGCSDDAFEKKAAKWDQCGPSLRSPRKRTN
ncbi:hypothetical protein AXG93_1603s1070 [Marchantia polymorpha subsp. ruderalis]|uniref:Uncharacterized protein n=1 Tax=Marchantia polymorpha subsp. ruderalis TaxID=1480154 RepID=A0A176VXH4_MARPO|nr:hypothetical protein AXG93_1603s1070 [Marchantia polymorpha subsp. ruderalis]